MKEANIIREFKSPWEAHVLLVSKKDGSIRFCVDNSKLNLVSTKDVYPLLRIDDCLSAFSKGCWFSTIHLTSGYSQIPVEEGSKHTTAFKRANGLYEFNMMPFGLTNSPDTFQRFMDATQLISLKTLYNSILKLFKFKIELYKVFSEKFGSPSAVYKYNF